jgi:hypothetical protein
MPPISQPVIDFIRGMINGTTSVEVGHMMFSTQENFQNLQLDYALTLVRRNRIVQNYIAVDDPGSAARADKVRECVADYVRDYVIRNFDTASYPGD